MVPRARATARGIAAWARMAPRVRMTPRVRMAPCVRMAPRVRMAQVWTAAHMGMVVR
jgi:hypothetical protein